MSGGRWKAVMSTAGRLTSVFSRRRSASFPALLHMIHALLSQHYCWESQKIREGMKRKFVPCQVETSARDNATPGKATEEKKYSSDGSHCWLQSLAESFSKSFWMSCLSTSRKAQWSRSLLCWASLVQVSVRFTLALSKTMLFGLMVALKYGTLSSEEKLRDILESRSGSFPMYYCHWMLSLKDYFSRRQKLGFRIFPHLLQICTLFFHLFLLMEWCYSLTYLGRKKAHMSLYILRAYGSDPDLVSSPYLPCRDTSCMLHLVPRGLQERLWWQEFLSDLYIFLTSQNMPVIVRNLR